MASVPGKFYLARGAHCLSWKEPFIAQPTAGAQTCLGYLVSGPKAGTRVQHAVSPVGQHRAAHRTDGASRGIARSGDGQRLPAAGTCVVVSSRLW